MTIPIIPRCPDCGAELHVNVNGLLLCENCDRSLINNLTKENEN